MAQAMIMRRGGGKAGSLKVKAYANAASLPATASTYEMAIITSVTLGKVVIGTVQPTSPANGDVWCDTSRTAQTPLRVTETPESWLYPCLCMQYVSGTWVFVNAYTYSGSAWVEWYAWLYQDGDERIAIGGAWLQDWGSGTYSVVKSATYITMTMSSSNLITLRKTTALNLTDYRFLKLKVQKVSGNNAVIAAHPVTGAYAWAAYTAQGVGDASGTVRTISLDVSALNGNYYIIFGVSDVGSYKILQAWLER